MLMQAGRLVEALMPPAWRPAHPVLQMHGWRFRGHAISVELPRGEHAPARPLLPRHPSSEERNAWRLIFSGLPAGTSVPDIVQFFRQVQGCVRRLLELPRCQA